MISLYLFAGLGRWVVFAVFMTFSECEAVGDQIIADGDVQEYECIRVDNG